MLQSRALIPKEHGVKRQQDAFLLHLKLLAPTSLVWEVGENESFESNMRSEFYNGKL